VKKRINRKKKRSGGTHQKNERKGQLNGETEVKFGKGGGTALGGDKVLFQGFLFGFEKRKKTPKERGKEYHIERP